MRAIHFECLPEECVLRNLGYSNEYLNHHNGRGKVCKVLQGGKNLNGWVDEDAKASHHPYYRKLYDKNRFDKYGVKFCVDSQNNNRLIIIKDQFESWIIKIATHSGVQMNNLSDDPETLHGLINFNIGNLQKVIHQLLKKDNPAILKIKEFLLID